MRVLQVVPDLKSGGGEWLALSLHRWLAAAGVDSRILSLIGDVNESSVPRNHRASFLEAYGHSWHRVFRVAQRMNREGWRPDVVHAHMYPSQLVAATMIKRIWPDAALSTTEHSTSNRRRSLPFGRLLDSLLFRQFRSLVCISQATLDSLQAWQPRLSDRLMVIPNGISLTAYLVPSDREKRERTVVISVGRLEAVKNYATALAAFAQLKDLPLEYWIVGQGSEAESLPRLASELGLARRVRFLGWRDDVADLLRAADIFFMPSRWEGFGLAMAQGLASALPVVASDIPASRELLGTAQAGFLCAPTDSQGFAAALRLLTGNVQMRQKLGDNARRRALEFDFEKTATQYLDLFKNLAGRHPSVQVDPIPAHSNSFQPD